MNVSRRWLEAFLRRPLDAADVSARLASQGAAVDAIEPLHQGLEGIKVALVEEVRQHPNADRLRVCSVNDGSGERRQVVCGAPNVTAGRKYPFAPVGSSVPVGKGGGPMKIERAKLRGETSEGMLCSARELGVGVDADGLWELSTDAAPGTPLLEALPLDDERIVVDVTPNRPDLLCHKGIARELGASYNAPIRLPELPGAAPVDIPRELRVHGRSDGVSGGVRVTIEDHEGCKRFHAAVIRGVKVGPSPDWLKRRLEAVGVRSISNIVDVTNYVMFELNQPMHAYDLALVEGKSLLVRQARKGESVNSSASQPSTTSSPIIPTEFSRVPAPSQRRSGSRRSPAVGMRLSLRMRSPRADAPGSPRAGPARAPRPPRSGSRSPRCRGSCRRPRSRWRPSSPSGDRRSPAPRRARSATARRSGAPSR